MVLIRFRVDQFPDHSRIVKIKLRLTDNARQRHHFTVQFDGARAA
jgi:hypothetical protein